MKNLAYKYFVAIFSMLYQVLIRILPLNKRVILFESSVGRNYSGNPKYIYEELVRQNLDTRFKCVWILENTETHIPGQCKKQRKMRLGHLFYASTAGLWVVDSRQPHFLYKRKGCKLIQTWHGTPLKKLALDMEVMNIGRDQDLIQYKSDFVSNARQWDALIAQNGYSIERFRSAFGYDGEIWGIGYPRNDILINLNDKVSIAKIKMKLGLPLDKKVILYAPTWRDDEFYEPGSWKLNLHFDLERLMNQFNNEFILIIKQHYFQQEKIQLTESQKNFIYIFNSTQDIQPLYLVADMMITDYSSVMFDYSILRRPMIFYLYDIEKYKNELRGFYFDIVNLAPGPVVYNEEQLFSAIYSWKSILNDYGDRYERFVEEFNHLDDGKSAARVVDKVKQFYVEETKEA